MIKGFKMKLNHGCEKLYPGQEKEYEKRHNELWTEMKSMLKELGGSLNHK